jgi:hypothetical protein
VCQYLDLLFTLQRLENLIRKKAATAASPVSGKGSVDLASTSVSGLIGMEGNNMVATNAQY